MDFKLVRQKIVNAISAFESIHAYLNAADLKEALPALDRIKAEYDQMNYDLDC